MNFKQLVIAGCSVLLPLGFSVLRPNEAQAQAMCARNLPNVVKGYRAYYFDPNRQIGCYQGWWHRYRGTPSFEGAWWAVNSTLSFVGPSAGLYDLNPIGAQQVLPIRVNLR
ncbi:hypothetical protein [Allocoleopsis franciscana]|uniref:Uncharacterized protein n=1 Tax=Allocoleopsis franciscana PCC 7113 TaxID=1173027 RepID=K9W811_9CYAN|nr:hypothetical protein [Allocoleopsis franciscana]AFZ16525.1 hypothetical protein Mic7113_0611 [Allocoleopsis franciscana PCC 7113]